MSNDWQNGWCQIQDGGQTVWKKGEHRSKEHGEKNVCAVDLIAFAMFTVVGGHTVAATPCEHM
jgi:hypothetical protein